MNEVAAAYARAVGALNRGDWQEAGALADRLLRARPDHAGVHFVAGVAALQLQQMPRALGHLQKAVELNPQRADYLAQFARALAAGHLVRQAAEVAARALVLEPTDPLTLDTLGVVFTQANAHAQAARAFGRAAALAPDVASYRFNHATSLIFAGDIDAAEREYEACLALDARYWKAHLALSQLRRQSAERNHLDRLAALLAESGSEPAARLYLHLALAKEYEDLRDYPRAFEHLVAGKAAGGAGRGYTIERDKALFDALMRAFPTHAGVSGGAASREPIFVIGMPRTGTTLVDRILSSHPHVHSAGELPNFGVLLKRASGSRTPHLLDADTVERARSVDWARLGEAYVASTRPGTGHTPRFVDKLPHNFLYAGFIARALPNAKLVCLRRDPLDTCLSNFRQLFAQGSSYYDYSFDLLDTGRYYVLFERLMAHWRAVLPGRVLELRYEDLVDDQERETRRLLEFCELPWDDACLRFEHNPAPVATASAVQVREPLHRGSIGRWRRYGTQLGALRALLAAEGVAMDEAESRRV